MYYHYAILKKGSDYLAILTNPNTQYELGHYYDQGYAFCMNVNAFNANSAIEIVKQNENSEIIRLQAELNSIKDDYQKLLDENRNLKFGNQFGFSSSLNAINPLEIFGFSELPSKKELKKKYRQLSQKFHPDKDGSTFLFQLIKDAFEQLEKTAPNK